MMDSVQSVRPHRQIIHFVGGVKRTINDVIFIEENEMTRLITLDGREWLINKTNVLAVNKIYEPLQQHEGGEND